MAKPLAISTQLKNALLKIEELNKHVAEQDRRLTTCANARTTAENELAQIHSMLDAVPNPVARKREEGEWYEKTERSALTRLAAWLASK